MSNSNNKSNHKYFVRVFDVFFSVLLLTLVFVPFSILILVKLIMDGRPLFYNSKRIGINGKSFTVYKFRTMVNDREFIENYLKQIYSYGFEKIPHDAIVYTKMGRIFEKFQIVEFLQIFNVLEGKMSLIGYRPLPVLRVLQLEEQLGTEKLNLRHSVLPGITGLSQIVGKSNLSNEKRIAVEVAYNNFFKSKSQITIIAFNTLIIIETFIQVAFRREVFVSYLKRKMLQPDSYPELKITSGEITSTFVHSDSSINEFSSVVRN